MAKKSNGIKIENRNLLKKMSAMLELPSEITLNLPLLTMVGNEELLIENYKGVIEYTEEKIRINTSSGVLMIEGKNLALKHITSENISVVGKIQSINYLY